jgi:hypothetical protein
MPDCHYEAEPLTFTPGRGYWIPRLAITSHLSISRFRAMRRFTYAYTQYARGMMRAALLPLFMPRVILC